MGLIVFVVVAALCMALLRSAWRMLVEVPDADQVWVPDLVDAFLSRSVSALLIAACGLFLLMTAQAVL